MPLDINKYTSEIEAKDKPTKKYKKNRTAYCCFYTGYFIYNNIFCYIFSNY